MIRRLCMITACALALGAGFTTFAQDQKGLVNVKVEDNTVQVPVSVAAAVCGLDVNVLAKQFAGTDETACTIDQETAAEHNLPGYGDNADGKGGKQSGLVNVDVSGNTVQVPVGIAAQVCDVTANVLAAQFVGTDKTACSIDQETAAKHDLDRFSKPKGEAGKQSGLVNLDVSGNTVQVPVGVAAEVCGVDANVIAQQFKGTEKTVCTIDQETAAEHGISG